MSNIEYVKLKEITTKITKGTTPSNIGANFTETGINYFRSEMLGKSKYLDKSSGLLFISEDTHKKLKRSQIEANDLLFSMAGAYLGKLAIVLESDVPANTNQAVALIRFNENINIDYVYYFMVQPSFTAYVNCMSAQAAQPNINLKQIGNLQIAFPVPAIQSKIASILSTYDKMIENNNKRIKILEQMAENIYKEWFVRFRFPNYENTEFENGIPKEWEYKMLSEITGVLQRGISPDYDDDGKYTVISQKCIRGNIMDINEARQQTKEYKSFLNLENADTVICSTGTGTLGRVGKVIGKYPNTTYDSHVTLARAKNGLSKQFLYGAIKNLQPWFMNMGIGSTNQQELYISLIRKTKILIPTEDLLEKYECISRPIHDKLGMLISKNENLIKQRDLLLPRLMSGKLEV